jgi:hypothetical protein
MTRDLRISLLLLLFVAAVGCGRKEAVEEFKARWIRLRHSPIEEARQGGDATVEAEVEVSGNVKEVALYVFYETDGQRQQPLRMTELEGGKYFAPIPLESLRRGTLITYYIEAQGDADLTVQVPADREHFSFYYKGIPNRPLLITHVVLMFVSLVIILIAGYLAFRALKDRRIKIHVPRLAFLGAAVFFVSSFPLGMLVAYQTYGKPWTGFPLGTDITDNKSLAIVLYWAAATFFYRGAVFRKDPTGDLLPMQPLPYIYMAGAALTVALFLIPH